MARSAERAAHEHSLVALYICPDTIEVAGDHSAMSIEHKSEMTDEARSE